MGGDDSFAAAKARYGRIAARARGLQSGVNGGALLMGARVGRVRCCVARREAKRQEWRGRQQTAKQEALAAKLSSAAQAEADKMAAFRALVAAQGGRISIPKRNP